MFIMNAQSANDVLLPPADPAERILWVRWQLGLRGTTIARLSRDHGWSSSAIARALRVPSYRQEQALADELGMPVKRLFPERYAPDGTRLVPIREPYAVRVARGKSNGMRDNGKVPRSHTSGI